MTGPFRSPPLPMIRFFASVDDSDIGKAAFAYCESLVNLGCRIRLLAATVANLQFDDKGRSGTPWGKFRSLLMTPVNGPFVNLVCTEPEYWAKFLTTIRPDGCQHNALIATRLHTLYTPKQFKEAWGYEVVCVPTEEICGDWFHDAPMARHATVVAPTDLEALQNALTPY